jgi:hypothetical protein
MRLALDRTSSGPGEREIRDFSMKASVLIRAPLVPAIAGLAAHRAFETQLFSWKQCVQSRLAGI